MTHALTNWLWRFISTAGYPTQDPSPTDETPMKIEIERLPDYLWRELGFRPVRRRDDDPWGQIQ